MDLNFQTHRNVRPMGGNYEHRMKLVREKLAELPLHTPEEIEWTARRLEMQNVRFEMGRNDLDLFRMTKDELLEQIRKIESWSTSEAVEHRNFEPELKGGDPEVYARIVKADTAEFLLSKFEFLSRLRSDDPEAWDTISEQYYSD